MRRILLMLLAALVVTGCGQDEKVTKLAEQLRRMDSDTKVGINVGDYTSRLRDLSFSFDEVQRADVGSDDFRKEAGEAVALYKDAGAVWTAKIGLHNTWSFTTPPWLGRGAPAMWWPSGGIPGGQDDKVAEVGSILTSRQVFPGQQKATMEEAMSRLWQMAKEHSDKALKEAK